MSMGLLRAEALELWRGEHLLLDQVNLSLPAGSLLQVIGENGSGKTTLLRTLIGLVEPDAGTVYWDDEPLPGARDALHAQLLYIGHQPGINANLTPEENLRVYATLHGGDASCVEHTLADLGIGDCRHLRCSALSAGQQRRVALARLAMHSRPSGNTRPMKRLWVLDEPLTALDSHGRDWVGGQLATQVESGGSVLFTSHQLLHVPGHAVREFQLGSRT